MTKLTSSAFLSILLLTSLTLVAQTRMTNADVIELTRDGLGPEVILAILESSDTAFQTDPDELALLSNEAVHDSVIAAMVSTMSTQTTAEDSRSGWPQFVYGAVVGIVAALSGALAGAYVSAWLTRKRDAEQRALEVAKIYQENYTQLADVVDLLEGQTAFTNEQFNQIYYIANWFDIIAGLIEKGHVDRQLVSHMGIVDNIRQFHEDLKSTLPQERVAQWAFINSLSNQG
ncbi:MAG: hypothetical protein OXC69_05760 [Candidatus Tectomicrobia bacterium]|nr:hypothetical protein [Candidatus Tectomicrobia bacterium]